jgi:hypothetical protein
MLLNFGIFQSESIKFLLYPVDLCLWLILIYSYFSLQNQILEVRSLSMFF